MTPDTSNGYITRGERRTAQVPSSWTGPANGRSVANHFDRKGTAPAVQAQTEPERKPGLHVYGKSSAFTIKPGNSAKGVPVVYIEAAAMKPESGNFNWESKIIVILTPEEQLHVLAVALNYLPRATGKHLGPERHKWFEIEHQGQNLYLKVGQGKTVRAAPIGAADAFKLAALVSAQIRRSIPANADSDLHLLLRRVFAPLANAPPTTDIERTRV